MSKPLFVSNRMAVEQALETMKSLLFHIKVTMSAYALHEVMKKLSQSEIIEIICVCYKQPPEVFYEKRCS